VRLPIRVADGRLLKRAKIAIFISSSIAPVVPSISNSFGSTILPVGFRSNLGAAFRDRHRYVLFKDVVYGAAITTQHVLSPRGAKSAPMIDRLTVPRSGLGGLTLVYAWLVPVERHLIDVRGTVA
jgi:hypothetical protein